jgi:hypothetical protein
MIRTLFGYLEGNNFGPKTRHIEEGNIASIGQLCGKLFITSGLKLGNTIFAFCPLAHDFNGDLRNYCT